METYEYTVRTYGIEFLANENEAASQGLTWDMGQLGYSLVGTVPIGPDAVVLIFQRPVELRQ